MFPFSCVSTSALCMCTLAPVLPWFEFLAFLDSGFDWLILKYTNDFDWLKWEYTNIRVGTDVRNCTAVRAPPNNEKKLAWFSLGDSQSPLARFLAVINQRWKRDQKCWKETHDNFWKFGAYLDYTSKMGIWPELHKALDSGERCGK